jgi:hypothetical protein
MWSTIASGTKQVIIGWWLAVVILVVLLYRRGATDVSYILIALVVALLYLLAFAAYNGAQYNPQGIYVMLIWVIISAIVAFVLVSLHISPWITVAVCFLLFVLAVVTLVSFTFECELIVYLSAVLLVFVNLIIAKETVGYYELFSTIVFQLVALYIYVKVGLKESLLTMVLSGIIVGLDIY